MAIKYIPYFPNTLEGQALLDNFNRTKRILRYRDNDRISERIQRGMPLYETELREHAGENKDGNLIIRGECLSACAYLKDKDIKVDLVYIDPPFASGADYAKKVYLRRNPKVAKATQQAESALDIEELRTFEEKMYGDIWNKESYLNWMYENLMAIKSVMSETASIYVHLDWHIGHYVKILMDEVFGEDNFINEIIWCYNGPGSPGMRQFNRKHDTIFWYCRNIEKYTFNDNDIRIAHNSKTLDNFKRGLVGSGFISDTYDLNEKGKIPEDWWQYAVASRYPVDGIKRVEYSTEKPYPLIERIIKASSNENDIIADFFGGSGVLATAAFLNQRKFIHVDVNINSIQTTRDRLKAANAEFGILEIKDGVSLYRNPVQTMEKLKSLIPGLRNEDALDKFWEGSIVDSQYGMTPVYLPNLMDGTTRVLDKPLMNRIIHEALPDLPENTKRVIVYYIDIDNQDEIERFIKEQNDTLIKIELRDLKQVLDEVVAEDYAEWNVSEEHDALPKGWKVEILQFQSDRVRRKIDELNQRNQQQALKKYKKYVGISLSENGLETIEWISLDCTSAEKNAAWHSDTEIKVDKYGYVIKNGKKTNAYWDASIRSLEKPLRMKIRNICGDETVFCL